MKLLAKILRSWWLPWLLGGLVIRLILMPITLHPDLLMYSFSAHFFADEGRLNLYDTLASLPPIHPLARNFNVSDIFIYPPLTYFTLGIFRILVKPWTDPFFIPWLMNNLADLHFYPKLYWHLLLFKLPYLFVDLGLAYFLVNLFSQPRRKKLALILWLFNPVTLYATFMIGQIDLLPTFLVVLAIYLFRKDKPGWGMVCLGMGAGYKMFPLFLILPAAFLAANTFKDRLKYIFLGLLPFVIAILPFLGSAAFRSMALFNPKNQKMLFMGWPVSGAEVVYPFVIGIFLIYFLAYYAKRRIPICVYFLSILLLTFSVTHYHPQWFLWITPLLIWELVENNFKHLLLVVSLSVCWLAITLLFEPSLSYGLFNPLWPQLDNAPALATILGKYTDVFQAKSIIRSVFAASALFFTIRLFLQRNFKNSD